MPPHRHAHLVVSASDQSLAGQILRTGCGSILLFCGLLVTVVMSAVLLSDSSDSVAKAVVLVLLGLLPSIAGGFLLNSFLVHRKRMRHHHDEQLILQVAASHQGRVTAAQVARASQLPLATVANYLDEMARLGHVSMDLAEDGSIFYLFPGLLSPSEPVPMRIQAEAHEQVYEGMDPHHASFTSHKR